MSAPDDDTQSQLENALVNINGVEEVLQELADTRKDGVLSYLSNRLNEHYNAAYDAFCRIYKLEKYETAALATDKE